MRFLLYGEVSRPGSGAWCYADALTEMGHEVVSFSDYEELEAYRESLVFRTARRILRHPLEHHRRNHALAFRRAVQARRPHIVVVLKGLLLNREDVLAARNSGSWVANINHDDFFSLNRSNWSKLQREAIPNYDGVFTTRAVNVEELRPLNGRVELLQFAYHPRIHRPVALRPEDESEYRSDVVFVGTWEAERAALMEGLVQQVPASYRVWGADWHKLRRRSPLRPYIVGREAVMDGLAKAIGGAKIALAFLRKSNRDEYTQRSFEIPACGGVLLGERTSIHSALYREGIEAEFFASDRPEELWAKVRHLLADEALRCRIRDAGSAALVRGRHTYRDRMEQLIAVYGEQRLHRRPDEGRGS
jgi:hypothetical protein